MPPVHSSPSRQKEALHPCGAQDRVGRMQGAETAMLSADTSTHRAVTLGECPKPNPNNEPGKLQSANGSICDGEEGQHQLERCQGRDS